RIRGAHPRRRPSRPSLPPARGAAGSGRLDGRDRSRLRRRDLLLAAPRNRLRGNGQPVGRGRDALPSHRAGGAPRALPAPPGPPARPGSSAWDPRPGPLAGPAGALAAGFPDSAARRFGIDAAQAERAGFLLYSVLGLVAALAYARLSPAVEHDSSAPARPLLR